MSLIVWLAGSVSLASFRERVLGIQAYAGLGLAEDTRGLVSWARVSRLLASSDARVELLDGGRARAHEGVTDLEAMHALLAAGVGVRVSSADTLDTELGALADVFGAELGGCAAVHVSASPARGRGLGWRRLGADSFFAQATGGQDHHFRPDTAHAARSPRRALAEVPPAHACALEPGDWLYVPRGWWHRTEALEESLSMTIEIDRPWPIARAPKRALGDRADERARAMKAFEEACPDMVRAWCGEGEYVPSSTRGVDVLLRRSSAPAPYRTPLRLLNPSAPRRG